MLRTAAPPPPAAPATDAGADDLYPLYLAAAEGFRRRALREFPPGPDRDTALASVRTHPREHFEARWERLRRTPAAAATYRADLERIARS